MLCLTCTSLFGLASDQHALSLQEQQAKMLSLPSSSTPQPTWYRNLKMQATDPFEIEWLSTSPCERHHVGHLRNTLNDDLPVTRSRDGQEISEAAGLEMVRIMSREARKAMNGGVFGGV